MGAATYDLTGNGYPGNYGVGEQWLNEDTPLRMRYIDNTVLALGNSTYKIFTIPAGSVVHRVFLIAKTAEGGAATVSIGDTSSDTIWQNVTSVNTSTTSVVSSAAPKYYASADEIHILPSTSLANSQFWIGVEMLALNTKM